MEELLLTARATILNSGTLNHIAVNLSNINFFILLKYPFPGAETSNKRELHYQSDIDTVKTFEKQ